MSSVKIKTRLINQNIYSTLIDSGIDPLMARLSASRAVTQAHELDYQLKQLLPYKTLLNCIEAAARIADAIHNKEKMLIVADYDVDGATACTLAVDGITKLGGRVDYIVPNRFDNGYGLTNTIVDRAIDQQTELLITVDNGISSFEAVKYAKEKGLEIIITDHHLPGKNIPNCLIVNPNQNNCSFKSKNLAGVGVFFYVLMALRATLRERGFFNTKQEPSLADFLDLVALGTVADVVPLDYNNRIMVSQGLKRMRHGKMRPGIKALFDVAKRDWKKAEPFDMGFALGPRINAAGRIDDMSNGIACLLATNEEQAEILASHLNELNHERVKIEQSMLEDALKSCPETLSESQFTLVAFNENFHQGVVGIVASRLKDKYYRPTFVFAPNNDRNILNGSGRSIHSLHLRNVLELIHQNNPNLLLKFGGHAMAAGLSLKKENLPKFTELFEIEVKKLLSKKDLEKIYLTDGSMPSEKITIEQAQIFSNHIWGQDFPPPTFSDEFTVTKQKSMGVNHKKAWLKKDDHPIEFEAMFWRCQDELPNRVKLVYRPVSNEWRNQIELQLYVDYWEKV